MSDEDTAPDGSHLCPCGARAWSLDELLAQCHREDDREFWRSLLAPDGFYCAEEDDVLLPGEARSR